MPYTHRVAPTVAHGTVVLVALVVTSNVVPDHTWYCGANPPVVAGTNHVNRTWVGSETAAVGVRGAVGVTHTVTVLLARLVATAFRANTSYRQPNPPGTAVEHAKAGNDALVAVSAVEPKYATSEYDTPRSVAFANP
jgi:hypothetical protein